MTSDRRPAVAGWAADGWAGACLELAAFIGLALVLAGPALGGELLWDDGDNLVARPLFDDVGGLWRIWCEPGATQQYYPLTHTTFWVERRLFGLWTVPFHVTNAVLHGVASFLLFRVLRRLEVPAALLAAALFAVHPLQVESVAWITERKNVLSGALGLGAALAYLRAVDAAASATSHRHPSRWAGWGGASALYVGALLAKTTLAMLPPALALGLALRAYRRHGRGWARAAWREGRGLIAWLPLGLAAGLWTAALERRLGAQGAPFSHGYLERCQVAGHALWFYVGKLVWPAPLSFVYPRWELSASEASDWVAPLAALALGAALVALRARLGVAPLVAALAYAALLFPALGFFDVVFTRFSWVQDHFAYLATIPVLALAAAALQALAERWRLPPRGAVALAGTLVAAALVGATARAAVFRTSEGLYRDTLAKNPRAWLARFNLAVLLTERGELAAAAEEYERVVAEQPELSRAFTNLGVLRVRLGDPEAGLRAFERAVELEPTSLVARRNAARLARDLGRHRAAKAHFEAAVLSDEQPEDREALGRLLATSPDPAVRDGARALALLAECLERVPEEPRCWGAAAAAEAARGDFAAALRRSDVALAAARRVGDPHLASSLAARREAYERGEAGPAPR